MEKKVKEREEARRLRKLGHTYPQIVSMIGCPSSSVYNWVHDIQMPTEYTERIGKERQEREQNRGKVLDIEKVKKFIEEGLTAREIGNRFGCSKDIVKRNLEQYGLVTKNQKIRRDCNTKTIGNASEAVVLAELVKRGKTVLMPFGDNARYDLVIDEEGKMLRIQVKTGCLEGDKVVFPTCNAQGWKRDKQKGYRGEADLFGVWCPEINKVFLVPVGAVCETACRLRLTEDKERYSGANYASDYELK